MTGPSLLAPRGQAGPVRGHAPAEAAEQRSREIIAAAGALRSKAFREIDEATLTRCLQRTPLDQHVIWTGRQWAGRSASVLGLALGLIDAPWSPTPLRDLIRRAARLSGSFGLDPEAVRKALWGHQGARPSSYFLVRRGALADYFAVTDIPWPASWSAPIRAGELVVGGGRPLERGLAPGL